MKIIRMTTIAACAGLLIAGQAAVAGETMGHGKAYDPEKSEVHGQKSTEAHGEKMETHGRTTEAHGEKMPVHTKQAALPGTPLDRRIEGQVVDVQDLKVEGEPDHVVARVRTPELKHVVVDLGPKDALARTGAKVKKGQLVTVTGRSGRIGDRPVVVVSQLEREGRTFAIRPTEELGLRNVKGRVVAVREITPAERTEKHYVAVVRQDDGRQVAIDLGPSKKVKESLGPVTAGMRLDAIGRPGTLAGQPALVVTRVQNQDRQVVLNEDLERRPDRLRIEGEIQEIRAVRLRGQAETHSVAKIRTRDGQTVIVDLGSRKALSRNLKLQKGDTAAVIGSKGRINGKPVILASRVLDVAQVERPAPRG